MRRITFLSLAFCCLANAEKNPVIEEHFEGPREFQEDVIADSAQRAVLESSGQRTVEGVDIQWTPQGTILHSKDKSKLETEAQSIRESLLKSPKFKDLVEQVKLSPEGTSLDLRPLLEKIKMRIDPIKCDICFSLPMCFDDKLDYRFMDDKTMEGHLSAGYEEVSRLSKLGSGDVVVLRKNFLRNDAHHAYLHLSPLLGLEIRGTGGHLLMRPHKEIQEEYEETARMERASLKEQGHVPRWAIGKAMTLDYWKRK